MKIYDEVVVPYEGKEYTVKGSFSLINKIEQRINLRTFEQQAALGTTRLTDIAWMVYAALSYAGCNCTYSEVGDYFLANDDVVYNGEKTNISELYGFLSIRILESCFPKVAEESADEGNKKKS